MGAPTATANQIAGGARDRKAKCRSAADSRKTENESLIRVNAGGAGNSGGNATAAVDAR